MPQMPRLKGKGVKIAYAILGIPGNLQKESPRKNKVIERTLIFDETSRVK